MKQWTQLESRIAYENSFIRIREDKVTTPANKPGLYGVVQLHNDSAYAVPITATGKYALVKQERYPLDVETWEFPSGQTDGDDPLTGARREMIEEVGYDSNDLILLSKIAADTGLSSSYVYIVLARGAYKVTDELDHNDGIIEVREFSPEQLTTMIVNGEIICPRTISAFFLSNNYKNKV